MQGLSDVVRPVYEAFGRGDLDAFVGLLPDDFVSTQSDAVPWRGTYRGPAGVREMFELVGQCGEATFALETLIEGEDRVVGVGQADITPAASGRRHAIRELHVWAVDDGRLRSLDVFLNAPRDLLDELHGSLRSA